MIPLAILVGVLVSSLPLLAQDRQTRRPNILFIIADDQSPFDLRVYDPKSPLTTPVLDQLAAEGMVIDGAYHMGSWSGAVCTPAANLRVLAEINHSRARTTSMPVIIV